MPDTVAELAARGRALNATDRRQLVDLLVDSLAESAESAVDKAWRLEIERRVATYERGESVLHDADEVMAEAKRLAP